MDVHLSTPYGVSGHLLVPAVTSPTTRAPAVLFQNGYIRYVGTIKKTPDPTAPRDDSRATFAIATLDAVNSGPVVAQLPRIQYPNNSATIKAQIFQQLPGEFQALSQPFDITPRLDAQQGTLVITSDQLAPLTDALNRALAPFVSRERALSGRYVLMLKGNATVATRLENEPIAGAIPIDILLTPAAGR